MLELLPGCQARQLFRGKGNYSSWLRAAKATQKGDCSSTKGVLCPAAVSHCPQLHPYPTQTTRTLSCWWERTINLTFPLFLPIMKRTEQCPTQPLTKHISVTNIEQTRPYLADEQWRWEKRLRYFKRRGTIWIIRVTAKKQDKFTNLKNLHSQEDSREQWITDANEKWKGTTVNWQYLKVNSGTEGLKNRQWNADWLLQKNKGDLQRSSCSMRSPKTHREVRKNQVLPVKR